MDQYEAEGRPGRVRNMFNVLREHPLDKKTYEKKLSFIVSVDYQAIFKDAEKPNADENTQKGTGIYISPYTKEPTGAQKPQRNMQ